MPIANFTYCFYKSIGVRKLEYTTLIIPFAVWFMLLHNDGVTKSLANLIEAPAIGVIISVLSLVHIMLGRKSDFSTLIYVVSTCSVSFVVYYLVPALPE